MATKPKSFWLPPQKSLFGTGNCFAVFLVDAAAMGAAVANEVAMSLLLQFKVGGLVISFSRII
jgi:hypothetical protein